MNYATHKEQKKLQLLNHQSLLVEKKFKQKQKQIHITVGLAIIVFIITIFIIVDLKNSLQENKIKQQILKEQQDKL